MANHFKVGDVVRLKSGGPQMTVMDVRRDSIRTRVACMWFGNKKQLTGTFFADMVTLAKSPFEEIAKLAAARLAASRPPLALPLHRVPGKEPSGATHVRRSLGEGGDWWADEGEG